MRYRLELTTRSQVALTQADAVSKSPILVVIMAITRTGTYERIRPDECISIRACVTAQRAQRSTRISQRNRVNQLSSSKAAQAT